MTAALKKITASVVEFMTALRTDETKEDCRRGESP
jgi:hypothetical protein